MHGFPATLRQKETNRRRTPRTVCFLFNGQGEQPPSKRVDVGGAKGGARQCASLRAPSCLASLGYLPPGKQAGRLTRARLHLRSRDPRLPPTGSRVGGTDRPPHQKVFKVLPSIAADWAAAVDTSGVLRVGWAPIRLVVPLGQARQKPSAELVPNTQGAVGPSGPSFMGGRGSPRHKQMP